MVVYTVIRTYTDVDQISTDEIIGIYTEEIPAQNRIIRSMQHDVAYIATHGCDSDGIKSILDTIDHDKFELYPIEINIGHDERLSYSIIPHELDHTYIPRCLRNRAEVEV